MTRWITIPRIILVIALVAEMYFGKWQILPSIWSIATGFISNLDDRILAALATGALVALGAIYGKYMENRYSVEAQFRNKKVRLFNDFIEKLQAVSKERDQISQEELVEIFKKWKREILFRSGPDVMRNFLALGAMNTDIETVNDLSKSMNTMGNLILSMRKDIGLSNRRIVPKELGIPLGTVFGARFLLKEPDLFFKAIRRSPTIKARDLDSDPDVRKSLQ